MIVNKLKAIFIAMCCLVAALWSEAQCMDKQTDILETATVNRTANIQTVSQSEFDNEIAPSDLVFTSSQVTNVEDSNASWASYLISPIKVTFQTANEFMGLATQNPKLAMVLGLTYFIPAIAANCFCYCGTFPNCKFVGWQHEELCDAICVEKGYPGMCYCT